MDNLLKYDILKDDLSSYNSSKPIFVTFGEVMIRETPADNERPERTRLVHLSMAGSEYSVSIGLSRMGIPSGFITRIPDNPYGKSLKNIANENNVNTDYIVWAEKTEPFARYIYELGRTPRQGIGIYQRKYSASSRLDKGMVDWEKALQNAKIFHTTGISFGLPSHSGYERNNIYDAFLEAIEYKPDGCLVGFDFNYRNTLWKIEEAKNILTKIIENHVDILITSIEDMALFYNINCGRYSYKQVLNNEANEIKDEDFVSFAKELRKRFNPEIIAVTKKYSDSIEKIKIESIAIDKKENISRTKNISEVNVADPLGAGDAWLTGFYYGLLTQGFNEKGIEKGIIIGDIASRLKHTLMFDLPVITREDINNIMISDLKGGMRRVIR